jgi:DNA gyrase/topoisomerase IV subunit A
LRAIVSAVLRNQEPPDAVPIAPGGGILSATKEDLKEFNRTGKLSATLSAKVRWIDSSNGQRALVVTDVPNYVNLKKLINNLKPELEGRRVFIRDESKAMPKLVIGRHKKVKAINDEQLEKRVRAMTSRKVAFACYFSHEGVAKLMTPHQVVGVAVNHAVKANLRRLKAKAEGLRDSLTFHRVKQRLAEMLMAGKDKDQIVSVLKITEEQYGRYIQKSISTLRKKDDPSAELTKELEKVEKQILKPRGSFAKEFGW